MQEHDGVDIYPINVETLKKGDVVPIEQLEAILGVNRFDPRFKLGVLGVRSFIERGFLRIGRLWTTHTRGGGITICTDSEAKEYQRKRFRSKLRGCKNAHIKNLAVDSSKLTAEEQKQHERTLMMQGATVAAICKARNALKLSAKKRETPLLAGESTGH